MEALANSRADLRLRKVDIVDWGSAVARQHGVRSLPSLVLYEGGKVVADDTRKVVAKLNAL